MIPTSTGAAKAMSLVLPSLKGKLDGTAIRVPTPNVSLIDLTFVPNKEVTTESINAAMSKAAQGHLKGILSTNSAPLVSKDFNHNPHSSIFDLTQTQVIKGSSAEYYLGMIMNGVFQIECVIPLFRLRL